MTNAAFCFVEDVAVATLWVEFTAPYKFFFDITDQIYCRSQQMNNKKALQAAFDVLEKQDIVL